MLIRQPNACSSRHLAIFLFLAASLSFEAHCESLLNDRAEALREALASARINRWTLLPHNVRLVPRDPRQKPCFLVRGEPGPDWRGPDSDTTDIAVGTDDFALVAGRSIVRCSGTDVLFHPSRGGIATFNGRETALHDCGGHVAFHRGLKADGQWFVLESDGLYRVGQAAPVVGYKKARQFSYLLEPWGVGGMLVEAPDDPSRDPGKRRIHFITKDGVRDTKYYTSDGDYSRCLLGEEESRLISLGKRIGEYRTSGAFPDRKQLFRKLSRSVKQGELDTEFLAELSRPDWSGDKLRNELGPLAKALSEEARNKLLARGMDLTRIGKHVRDGHQFYGGLWIRNWRLVEDDAPRSAVIAACYDTDDDSGRVALFRIQANGELSLLCGLPEYGMELRVVSAGDGNAWYGFSQKHGLLHCTPAGCRSVPGDRMLGRMTDIVASDSSGRLYFEAEAGWHGVCYVMNPRVEALDKPRDMETVECRYVTPEWDADRKTLWFVSSVAKKDRWGQPAGSTPVLCSFSDGAVTRRLENVPIVSHLSIGADGTVFVLPFTPWGEVLQLTGDSIQPIPDLHKCALQEFDRLMACAPSSTGQWRVQNCHRGLARTGELLWVCAGKQCEVYSQGKALGLTSELPSTHRGFALYGPLYRDERCWMLVIDMGHGFAKMWWVTVGDGGLEVAAATPPRFWSASASDRPVLDDQGGHLYVRNRGEVWRVSGPDTYVNTGVKGEPVFLTRDGGVIVRVWSPRYGYVRCDREGVTPIDVTFRRRIDIGAEDENGRLFAVTPDSLVRLDLGEDGWAIREEQKVEFPFTPGYVFAYSKKHVYVGMQNGTIAHIEP